MTVQNPVRVEMASDLETRVFSPNADGQEDSIDAAYCVSRDATVNVVVKNSSDHGRSYTRVEYVGQ